MSTTKLQRCFGSVYEGKRVLLTGHTGFKGSWLGHWLVALGADVTGVGLPPPCSPSLFEKLQLESRVRHVTADVRDLTGMQRVVRETRPDFVFHLAAQPLVRLSYAQPVETYMTNVIGTVNLLEALRELDAPCVAIMVTTDKCYENKEWLLGYREDDPMGGHDPYSSSKACAELVIASYRRSYFSHAAGTSSAIASVRAGNVIGGGDWAADRIIPDCFRAVAAKRPIAIRNQSATRPWQHVLEPLSGYLWLAAQMKVAPAAIRKQLSSAFNFGPPVTSNRSVGHLVQELLQHVPGGSLDAPEAGSVHEATRLHLITDKAFHLLGWHSVWDFGETVAQTADWYLREAQAVNAEELTLGQIRKYIHDAQSRGLAWAQ